MNYTFEQNWKKAMSNSIDLPTKFTTEALRNMSQVEYEELFLKDEYSKYLEEKALSFLVSAEASLEEQTEFTAMFDSIESAKDAFVEIVKLVGAPQPTELEIPEKREFHLADLVRMFSTLSFLPKDWKKEDKLEASLALINSLYGFVFMETTKIAKDSMDSLVPVFAPYILSYIVLDIPDELRDIQKGVMLPMRSMTPLDWTQTQSGGYILTDDKPTLKKGASKQSQEALDVLNILQSNRFNLSKAKKKNDYYSYLFHKQTKNGMLEQDAHVLAEQKSYSAHRAWEVIQDDDFSFQWKFDFRGRMYPTGYDVHLQSDKYMKGTIRPKNGKMLNEEGYKWLMVDLANTYGEDKLLWNDRIEWASKQNFRVSEHYEKAESPLEHKNAVMALLDAKAGREVNHMVYLDASNQALQLYATLMACKDTGKLCNMANGAELADAYQILADAINELFNMSKEGFHLTRSHCKKALMTTMYGKANASLEVLHAINPAEEPVDVLHWLLKELGLPDSDNLGDNDFKNAFDEALFKIAPNAVRAMEALQSLSHGSIETYYWTLPDGFNVKYDVKVKEFGEVGMQSKEGLNFTVKYETISYKANEDNRGIAPNVIHSVDGYVARELGRRMHNDKCFFTSVHDAFATHPNDCGKLIKHYKNIMSEILQTNLLQNIIDQIHYNACKVLTEKEAMSYEKPVVIKQGTLTVEDIMASEYILG